MTTAIASNAFAVAKILKIKAAIKAAGGATKFAKTAIDAFKKAKAEGKSNKQAVEIAAGKAGRNGGKAAVSALLEVFSLNAVLQDCFGVKI